ncbi:hypothetical protein AVEN_227291-1 [Araneus ventricosus]|uniref:Uncharacterized protein n=1 Tax=Araneus ventricosus TaxID=182803 RepID=A0A4Y2HFR9_ARAVE|nr:hypothetical protein AVEN_227291-1 [Araneus ventricosus]
MAASPPSFCPHKFHQNSLASAHFSEVPNQRSKKRPPFFVKFSPENQQTQTPVCPSLPPTKRPFPYVTGSYVTSLERSPKFRTRPDISFSRVFQGPCLRRNEEPPSRGKRKERIPSPLLFISWHKQIIISHTQNLRAIKSLNKT